MRIRASGCKDKPTVGTSLQLQLELQRNRVADEVSAITAVVRPILRGILSSLKAEVRDQAGGLEGLKLFMLARLRKAGDGDVGICFEYAVHDALTTGQATVTERVVDALRMCNVPGSQVASILFGAEKSGTKTLIATARQLLTPESLLLYGKQGRPAKLRNYIDRFAAAFRKPAVRNELPQSISGLWMADLFAGYRDTDRWIGTTLKINRDLLEGAKGLRLGIVPAFQGASDAIYRDVSKNLVVCPLPYDGSFMQIFYQAWEVVVQFLTKGDARVPSEVYLPRPASRQVARYLEDRRDHTVLAVIDALEPLAQPQLLESQQTAAPAPIISGTSAERATTSAVLAPIPRST